MYTSTGLLVKVKKGTGLMTSIEPIKKGTVGKRKMIRIYLIGMLCGVMITAAVTLVFAIPANSDHWRWEIWQRGGAAWTYDKSGHVSWKWLVEPIPDTPRQKPVIVPSSQTKVSTEQL
jgi:hypothetical protein